MTLFYEKLYKRAMIDIGGVLVYKEDRFSVVPTKFNRNILLELYTYEEPQKNSDHRFYCSCN